jgi:hypothetical protein
MGTHIAGLFLSLLAGRLEMEREEGSNVVKPPSGCDAVNMLEEQERREGGNQTID